jgi:hypothetical protein
LTPLVCGVHQSRITHGRTVFPVSGSLVPP